eukprot:3416707-Lingulodinium_polyedra.AAC.1
MPRASVAAPRNARPKQSCLATKSICKAWPTPLLEEAPKEYPGFLTRRAPARHRVAPEPAVAELPGG